MPKQAETAASSARNTAGQNALTTKILLSTGRRNDFEICPTAPSTTFLVGIDLRNINHKTRRF
jgi:hypothetical protein